MSLLCGGKEHWSHKGMYMYVCGSCGAILKKTGADMGLCPNCSRDSLAEKMLCPECGEEMDGPSEVEIMRQAWICRSCNIKVYKEHYE